MERLKNHFLLLLIFFGKKICSTHHFGFGADRIGSFRGHGSLQYLSDSDPIDPLVQERSFEGAVVDNFAPVSEQSNWSQRYFVNDRFCTPDCQKSTIFLYIGGEGPESPKHLSESMFMYDLARTHSALMLSLEHRFYGKSYPTENMSNKNLKYLSSAQALADLARFIPYIRDSYEIDSSSKLITFGGSYPGSLSAWARLKYPHLIDGAVASSAPILIQLDFPEYMDVCDKALREFGGDQCAAAMEEGANALKYLIVGNSTLVEAVASDFNVCTAFNSTDDFWVFATNVMGDIQGTVQYNRQKADALNVTDVCEILSGSQGGQLNENEGTKFLTSAEAAIAYSNLVELNRKFREASNNTCLESNWDKSFLELSNATFDGEKAGRQWTYQTCNEFGYFQTADSSVQPFKSFGDIVDVDSFLKLCKDIYEIEGLPQIDFINDYYGAFDIRAHRVAFPSGSLDPWSALSISDKTKLEITDQTAVFIPGTAHCQDMHSGDPTLHTPELDAAKNKIASLVALWIATDEASVKSYKTSNVFNAGQITAIALCCLFIGALLAATFNALSAKRKLRKRLELTRSRRSLREPLIGEL